MLVLVVEDDAKVAANLEKGLAEAGYDVHVAHTVAGATERLQQTRYDLLVLDLGLPDGDGLDILSAVRAGDDPPPVLVLTARDALGDRVLGLEKGADDYLTKPFAFTELLARIRALLRRAGSGESLRLTVADLVVDVVARTVSRADEPIEMTPREFDLLTHLARSRGYPVSREELVSDVWKLSSRATPMDNVIDVHISHLREKIDKPFSKPLLHTVRGVGFVLKESA